MPSSDNLAPAHLPTQGWSYRVPSPPHILVPPTPVHGNVHELRVNVDPLVSPESSGFTNAEFLRTIKFDGLSVANPMFSWKYEDRRTAQAVLPFLYLGPVTVANDARFLRTNEITMVLAVRNTKSAQAKLLKSKVAADLGIESHTIDVAGNQELIAEFSKGIETINTHLSAMHQKQQEQTARGSLFSNNHMIRVPGKVLVYCETGNDRSPLLVTAYIMAMFSMNLIKAIQVVQAKRFAVGYDDYSRTILQTYGSILQAKRDVIQASFNNATQYSHGGTGFESHHGTLNQTVTKASKRTLDEDDNEDMEMADNDQDAMWEGSARRGGFAPFHDGSGL